MEDDPGAADDERIIELSSIAAIFPEIVLDRNSPYQASLDISVSPAAPLKICFQHLTETSLLNLPTPPTSTEPDTEDLDAALKDGPRQKNQGTAAVHELVHLPSLNLKICLPEGYPAETAPVFELSSCPAWIPETTLQRLTRDGVRLWEELGRDQVIFTYIDHLQQAAEAGFDLAKDLGREFTLSGELEIALLDYDLKSKREVFEKETFDCGICLEPKKGAVCHRLLLCSHVFCVECLQECYKKCIAEGDVDNVKCLDPGCGKDTNPLPPNEQAHQGRTAARRRRRQDPTLSPSELLQIPLAEEVVQRYVHLKRKKKLESDKNTVYCPRQWCQGAARSKKYPKPIDPMHDAADVTSDSDEDPQDTSNKGSKESKTQEIPMSERLCICEDCSYAFCSVCKKGWHGELTSYSLCNPRSEKELTEEEKATAEYLALHSTPCPTCSAPCQKTMGCNHMICFKCRTHFCYLCSSYLMESNPYQHFNDKHNQCYMRLWELEDGDDENAQVVAWDIPPDGLAFDSDSDDDDLSDDDDDERDINWFERNPLRRDDDDAAHFSDEEEIGQEPVQRGRERLAAPADFPIKVRLHRHQLHHALAAEHANRGGQPLPQPRNRNPNQNQARGRGRGRGGGRAPPPPRAAAPEPARERRFPIHPAPPSENESDSSDTEDEVPIRFPRGAAPAPAPGQGNDGQQQPAMLRHMGIDRFLALAEQDQEDEWDSDELEEEVLDVVEERRRRAANRRIWG
ncbi:hypothetical protein EPUS_00296 [Endocarpon pusillum Z07020]|uniref:RBR-type E3 ubiquitin transferase n=1 Tax=Endocarpon pusillum (strain Z07020 / HMAS-L-300199) TaxID=1263415 RepID=U1HM85_ENDPU|nr:uncharacterized protein EPUS_00296 [Endocarpon pusillum Z07020]ERF70109.1 hypothetical protein EPUS_00296 [Endocarpon pusillum Z07020]